MTGSLLGDPEACSGCSDGGEQVKVSVNENFSTLLDFVFFLFLV